MAIMSWSSASTAKHHQHVADPMPHDEGRKLGGRLWETGQSRIWPKRPGPWPTIPTETRKAGRQLHHSATGSPKCGHMLRIVHYPMESKPACHMVPRSSLS